MVDIPKTAQGNVENGGWIAPLFYDPNDQMKIYSLG